MKLDIGRREFVTALGCATATWPLAALAQGPRRIPKIGVLWHAGSAEQEAPYFGSLIEGFRSLGYAEGSIALEHRFPNEKPELFASMAAELVSLKPDVLVAVASAAPYAKDATATIPIVFMYVADPIGAKLVDNIRRPGGNITGLTNFSVELSAKRLEFLKEIVPSLSRVALLVNPNANISKLYIEQSNAAGPKLGLTTQAYQVQSLSELEKAFDAMVRDGMQAVVVNAESLFYQGKGEIAKLAVARRLPTCVWVKEVLEAGALVSYGADQHAIARRVAAYVDRILKGEKPGDMPVEQPTRFYLDINLKTAKVLGLTVPLVMQMTADEVIE
ncbi:MAG: ABC transporter substrate-binding protein [Xanthobacteraceae bacterium]|jgi:putative ABC transport system substrate-binding protein